MTTEPISSYAQKSGVAPISATAPQNNPRTIVKTHPENGVHMMTEIDNAVFVAWTNCSMCGKTTATCSCSTGPAEPAYIREWRENRFKDSRRYPAPKPLTERTDRELLAYLLDQYDRVVQIHEVQIHDQVRMDTPDDVDLHDRVIAAFRQAAEPVRERLAHPEPAPTTVVTAAGSQGFLRDTDLPTHQEQDRGPTEPAKTDGELIGGGVDSALAAVAAARKNADVALDTFEPDRQVGDTGYWEPAEPERMVGATGYVQPVGTVPVDDLNPQVDGD